MREICVPCLLLLHLRVTLAVTEGIASAEVTSQQADIVFLNADGTERGVAYRNGRQSSHNAEGRDKKQNRKKRELLRRDLEVQLAPATGSSGMVMEDFGDVLNAHAETVEKDVTKHGRIGSAINVIKTPRSFKGQYADGAEDYVNFYDTFQGNFGGAFSVAFEVRFDSRAQNGRIIDFGNGPEQDNIVVGRKDATDDLEFTIHRREYVDEVLQPTSRSVIAKDVIPVNQTNTFLCVVDALGRMRMYKDGQVAAERKDGFAPEQVPRFNMFVGKSNWPKDDTFQGRLSNLRIWNTVVPWALAHPGLADHEGPS